jgi:hypothetical protein
VTLATERLNLFDVGLEYFRVLTLMTPIELGDVVDLNVVCDSRGQRAKAGRFVTIVFTGFEVFDIVVSELFFQRKTIKLATQGKLAIYLFLTDIEVLDVEESCEMSVCQWRDGQM